MRLVLFTESSPQNTETTIEKALRRFAESARTNGHYVVGLPKGWESFADEIVASVPSDIHRGIFSGYYRRDDSYKILYENALARGIALPNTPQQSAQAMNFGEWIRPLEDFTAKSWLIGSEQQLEEEISALPWPLFVKGGVKSRKEEGWEACVVNNETQLREQWARIQRSPLEETLIVREILPLRRSGEIKGFPCGREYRLLLWQGRVINSDYYWSSEDPFGSGDLEPLEELAVEAQKRLGIPLLAVDLGQLEDNSWKLIEVGDPQHTLFSFATHPAFWQKFSE